MKIYLNSQLVSISPILKTSRFCNLYVKFGFQPCRLLLTACIFRDLNTSQSLREWLTNPIKLTRRYGHFYYPLISCCRGCTTLNYSSNKNIAFRPLPPRGVSYCKSSTLQLTAADRVPIKKTAPPDCCAPAGDMVLLCRPISSPTVAGKYTNCGA